VRNFTLFLSFFITLSTIRGQVFNPPIQHIADNIPDFNFSEIKKRKIKEIVFDMVDKKDWQVAEDRDLSRHYEFDSLGRITRCYYTVVSRIIQKEFHTAPVYKRRRLVRPGHSYTKNVYEFDTLSYTFLYNEKGNLGCKRYNDGNAYTSTYYWYDSLNRVTRVLYAKETNSSPDKTVFVLGMQQKQFEENYKYAYTSDLQYKKLCLNDEGRVFKEIIVTFTKFNKPKQYNESFVATWINQVTDFSYNANNRLIEKKFTTNAGGPVEIKDTFEYKDDFLDMEKHYKNGVMISETGYVNDAATGLPTSYVTRDPLNKSMQIVRLLYSYYP